MTKPAERRLQTFFLLGVLSNDLRITPQKGARVACSCCLQVVNVDIMVDSMEVQEVERKTNHNMGSNLLAGTARCDSRHQDGIKNVGVALQSFRTFCNFCKGRDRLRAPALKRHASSIDSFLFFFAVKPAVDPIVSASAQLFSGAGSDAASMSYPSSRLLTPR